METASRQLHVKFDAAKAICTYALGIGIDIKELYELVLELEAKFSLSTGYLCCKFASEGGFKRSFTSIEFARVLAFEDFSGEIDKLVKRIEVKFVMSGVALRDDEFFQKTGKKQSVKSKYPNSVNNNIQRLLDMYPTSGISIEIPPIDYEHCTLCNSDMIVDTTRSELYCKNPECAVVRELVGTVFDESQFYSQEGQKAKSGTFNPNRHFQFWWMHILAREPEEEIGDKADPDNLYGEKLIQALHNIVRRDRKVLRMLTVNEVRMMLSELDKSNLNKNVPLILRKLTGVGPPSINDAITVKVENLFTKAIEIGERVRRTGRANRNYYPSYIFKILEHLLDPNDYESRRVLYYIYIQSKDTVEADDSDWELICAELNEIKYIPTDRTLGLKYHPR